MNRFRTWYLKYYVEITWFIIGWLTLAGFDALADNNYISAALNFGLAYVNIVLNKYESS